MMYVGGCILKHGKGNYGIIGPWIDILAYPTIAILMIVAKLGSNSIISTVAIIISIVVTLGQFLYNATNFTKSAKCVDLFQHREAKLTLIANVLHVCFLYLILMKWVERVSLSIQEQVIFTLIHLLLSAMKFREQGLEIYFIDRFAQKIGRVFFLMEINLGIIAFSHAVSSLDVIAANLPYILLNMTFLSNLSLKTYLRQRQTKTYLSKVEEIKGEDEALRYLDSLKELAIKI